MTPSKNCYDLIKEFEGCKLEAYPDPASGGEPWTIGVGSTKGVHKGMVITQEQADEYLVNDVAYSAKAVNQMVSGKITQNQFDALCSFAFNLGIGNLKNSTLLKKLNGEDVESAADQFLVWNKAAGKVMAGFTRRREAERTLFLS